MIIRITSSAVLGVFRSGENERCRSSSMREKSAGVSRRESLSIEAR
jgi:hypothetical protein